MSAHEMGPATARPVLDVLVEEIAGPRSPQPTAAQVLRTAERETSPACAPEQAISSDPAPTASLPRRHRERATAAARGHATTIPATAT